MGENDSKINQEKRRPLLYGSQNQLITIGTQAPKTSAGVA